MPGRCFRPTFLWTFQIFFDSQEKKIHSQICKISNCIDIIEFSLVWWVECSPMVRIDLSSIPGRVIPKTLKMVLDTSLLNTQQYKVFVSRVKWSHPGKGVAPFPTPRYSSCWKGSLWVALNYGRQLYLLVCIKNLPTMKIFVNSAAVYSIHIYIYIYIYMWKYFVFILSKTSSEY